MIPIATATVQLRPSIFKIYYNLGMHGGQGISLIEHSVAYAPLATHFTMAPSSASSFPSTFLRFIGLSLALTLRRKLSHMETLLGGLGLYRILMLSSSG